jgi:hypothetical protein
MQGIDTMSIPQPSDPRCPDASTPGAKGFLMSKQRFFNYESRHQALIPRHEFLKRFARNLALASTFIAISLAGGMAGYHFLEDLPWLDAFQNAAMILGGMGPVDPIKTSAGKLFAGSYALYSGLLVIVSTGVLMAPVFHRMLHEFHAEEEK